MKKSWGEAEEALDVLLEFVDSYDQGLPLAVISSAASQPKEVDKAANSLNKFADLADNRLGGDLTDFFREDQELNERGKRLEEAITILKEKYQK